MESSRNLLIAAANRYGVVTEACDEVLHMIKEKEEQKPVDAERFVQYIKCLESLIGCESLNWCYIIEVDTDYE